MERRFFLSACNPVQEFQPGDAPRPAPVGIGSGDDDLRLGISAAILHSRSAEADEPTQHLDIGGKVELLRRLQDPKVGPDRPHIVPPDSPPDEPGENGMKS